MYSTNCLGVELHLGGTTELRRRRRMKRNPLLNSVPQHLQKSVEILGKIQKIQKKTHDKKSQNQFESLSTLEGEERNTRRYQQLSLANIVTGNILLHHARGLSGGEVPAGCEISLPK